MNNRYQNGTCIYKELYFRVYHNCDLLEQRMVSVSNRNGYIWRECERFCKTLIKEWAKKLDIETQTAGEFSVDYGEEKIELPKPPKIVTGGYRDFPEDD